MSKYELKTTENDATIVEFLEKPENEKKKADSLQLIEIFREVTGDEAKMWGGSIIGFGKYHYKYASGHEGDMCKVGFSPRKQNFSLYLMNGFENAGNLLENPGKFKTAKACLYINKLSDVDEKSLRELIKHSFQYFHP